jgi:hypothetical protein
MKKILLIAALVLGSQAFAQSVDQKISEKTSCLSEGFTFARFYGESFITDIINTSVDDQEVQVIDTQVLDSLTVVVYESKKFTYTIELPNPDVKRITHITVVPKQ